MEAGTMGRTAPPVRTRTTGVRRLATETKASIKTSEWWLTSRRHRRNPRQRSPHQGRRRGRGRWFVARQAWLYVAIVAGAYAIGRGLAKSGSNEPYFAELDGDDLGNAGARNGDDR